MATVTMTGAEYKAMVCEIADQKRMIEEVTNWMKQRCQVAFPEESFTRWGAGKFNEEPPLPHWLWQVGMEEMARHFMAQDMTILKRLEANGVCRFSPLTRDLNNYQGDSVIPYFQGLESVWQFAHNDNEHDKEVAAEQEAQGEEQEEKKEESNDE